MKVLPAEIMDRIQARLEWLYPDANTAALLHRLVILAGRRGEWRPAAPQLWDQRTSLLIAYGDMVQIHGEKPLATLHRFAGERLKDTISHVHILPFFPSSSDEGFSVIDYRQVDPKLGTWEEIRRFSEDFPLMFDLVLNHCSKESHWFELFGAGVAPMRDYFITVDPTKTDLSAVVRPRTSPLLTSTQTPCGERCEHGCPGQRGLPPLRTREGVGNRGIPHLDADGPGLREGRAGPARSRGAARWPRRARPRRHLPALRGPHPLGHHHDHRLFTAGHRLRLGATIEHADRALVILVGPYDRDKLCRCDIVAWLYVRRICHAEKLAHGFRRRIKGKPATHQGRSPTPLFRR